MSNHLGVSAVEISSNSKVGKVSATYVSQDSCPKSCPLRNSGCYAESSFTGMQTRRLNRESASQSLTPAQLAREESRQIRSLTGRFPLRLHVVGDCATNTTAKIVSRAADEHARKFQNPVWTYTHAWRKVSRSSWGNVSVLASVEHLEDAKLAMDQGYAAAVVVPEHRANVAWRDESTGLRVIPCPEQTGKSANCESCQLCWKSGWLRANRSVIAFEAHGASKKVKQALVQIGGGA